MATALSELKYVQFAIFSNKARDKHPYNGGCLMGVLFEELIASLDISLNEVGWMHCIATLLTLENRLEGPILMNH